jgi:hypothetical protein
MNRHGARRTFALASLLAAGILTKSSVVCAETSDDRAPDRRFWGEGLRPVPPSMETMGRTVRPGVSILINRKEMPRCGFAVLSVRTRKKPHSDIMASLVQIFWPLTTHSSPSSTA